VGSLRAHIGDLRNVLSKFSVLHCREATTRAVIPSAPTPSHTHHINWKLCSTVHNKQGALNKVLSQQTTGECVWRVGCNFSLRNDDLGPFCSHRAAWRTSLDDRYLCHLPSKVQSRELISSRTSREEVCN
jgi:hypothetical protein